MTDPDVKRQVPGQRATGLSLAVIILVAAAFAGVVILHVVRTDFDPVRDVVSGYANGRFGNLMTSAFYALGVGSIVLAFRLRGVVVVASLDAPRQ